MAHPPRQYVEGYWYHVYARSVDEVRLFKSDEERAWFVTKLDDVFTRRTCMLGALCLMDTHYHALVQMGPIPLGRVLNSLHNAYTKHINTNRPRSGTLFDARPGADIILTDQYMLQLVPYIHQNPVKAGMVTSASEYKWSTEALYRGTDPQRDEMEVQTWRFPPKFQGDERVRVFQEQMDQLVNEPDHPEGYYGDESEWESLDRRKHERSGRYRDRRGRRSMEEIAHQIADNEDRSIKDLTERGRRQPEARLRQEAMVEMYEEGYGPKEIGDFFNRNKGTVVYAVNKFQGENS